MMTLGQAAGTAAAMIAQTGATARSLDVRALQRRLLQEGFNLGEEERLRQLGLG